MRRFHRHCVVLHHAATVGKWRVVPEPLREMLDYLCSQAKMVNECPEVRCGAAQTALLLCLAHLVQEPIFPLHSSTILT